MDVFTLMDFTEQYKNSAGVVIFKESNLVDTVLIDSSGKIEAVVSMSANDSLQVMNFLNYEHIPTMSITKTSEGEYQANLFDNRKDKYSEDFIYMDSSNVRTAIFTSYVAAILDFTKYLTGKDSNFL